MVNFDVSMWPRAALLGVFSFVYLGYGLGFGSYGALDVVFG